MKLSGLQVENFQGVRALDISPAAPVLLVAGKNHAGKSSLVEAIRCAFNGRGERVELKKELGALVTEGAKKGRVQVVMDGKPMAGLTLPGGEHVDNLPPDITLPRLGMVLSAEQFARSSTDERRGLLFDVTGCKATTALVRDRLIAKGADAKKVEAILPMLRSGFPAAAKDAENRAKDARGAWRGVTGEQWGDKKSEGWEAECPVVDAELGKTLDEHLAEYEGQLAEAQQNLGAKRQQLQAYLQADGRRSALTEKAATVKRIKQKLELDKKELEEWTAVVLRTEAAKLSQFGLPCPCCSEMLVEQNGALVKAGPLAQASEDDIANLPDYIRARDSYANAVQNDQRDLLDAEAAAAELEGLQKMEPVDANAVDLAKQSVDSIATSRNEVRDQQTAWRQKNDQANAAKSRTAQAAAHVIDVKGWALIADAMSPEGIPSELLSEALTPVNDLLHSLSCAAEWKRVQIGAGMDITADGRPYALLSESEKWRCDAVLAITIANLSGIRFAILDRFDVLDLGGRGQLIGLLDYVVDEGLVDSMVIAGTMKAAPTGLSENFETIWMENGTAKAITETKAA